MLRSPELRVARNEGLLTPSQPSRRLFLASALALGFATAARGVLGEELEPKDVNKHLDRIPRKLPHVVRRREDLYEGATHGLIVIRQIHWANDLDEEGAKEVARCQAEIRELLEALVRGKWIDSVHAEGMMAAGQPRPDPVYSTAKTSRDLGLQKIPSIAEVGADRQLNNEGLLALKGAERTKEYDAAGPAFSLPEGAKKQRLIYEDREEALLDIQLGTRDTIVCTVYGAAHDWEWNVEDRNLEEWNRKNPEKIISLLTLTVKSVADFDRKRYPQPDAPLPVPPPPEPLPPPPEPGDVEFAPKKGKKVLQPFIDFPF